MDRDQKLNREILGGNIDRDPVGSKLTSEAREKAIDFAQAVWKGNMGNGEASQIGIKHVTQGVLKDKK